MRMRIASRGATIAAVCVALSAVSARAQDAPKAEAGAKAAAEMKPAGEMMKEQGEMQGCPCCSMEAHAAMMKAHAGMKAEGGDMPAEGSETHAAMMKAHAEMMAEGGDMPEKDSEAHAEMMKAHSEMKAEGGMEGCTCPHGAEGEVGECPMHGMKHGEGAMAAPDGMKQKAPAEEATPPEGAGGL